MKNKEQIELYDHQAAEAEIYHVRQTARGLDGLIRIIKRSIPDYTPLIPNLEKLFLEKNVSRKVTSILAKAVDQSFSFDLNEENDSEKKLSELHKEISAAISGIQRGNWGYWYSINPDGSIAIKENYTAEIKRKHTYRLTGIVAKAYRQAENFIRIFAESRELIGNKLPRIPGLTLKDPLNGIYEINQDHFLSLAKRN